MRHLRLVLLSMLLLLPCLMVGRVSADATDFTVKDFSADYYLSRDDPQGSLHVRERISVAFTDYNHGILRAIPTTYHKQPLLLKVNSITSDTGAPTSYSKYSSNGNKVLKIGDPNKTITGNQEYTIDYSLRNVMSFYNDHDELYWDINGDQWDQPFTHVQATFHLPAGLQLSGQQEPKCFAGAYGATTQDCTVVVNGSTVTSSATDLGASQTLSDVIGFQKGYFKPASFLDHLSDYKPVIISVVAPSLLAFGIGFTWWFRRGRDARGRGTIIPEYAPPDGLSPLEAGTIADFVVDDRDITATIIDLARRGYLKIIETTHDHKLRKNTVAYTLELTKVDFTDLNTYETRIMEGLFDDMQVGAEVNLTNSKNTLYATANYLRQQVTDDLTKQEYFRQNPRKFAFKGGTALLVLILLANGFGGAISSDNLWPMIIGIVLGILILGAFIKALPARTAKGVAAREQLLGLKLYMETAEKDRLEKLEGPNAAYAANAGEPVRTVELFEKLLPYAIVLGVETQWAGKFNDIYKTPPTWYSGNWTAFNAGYLAGSLSSGFASAVNSSFTPPSSSGSSGFGGGGFSGGGGGGGGGGGW